MKSEDIALTADLVAMAQTVQAIIVTQRDTLRGVAELYAGNRDGALQHLQSAAESLQDSNARMGRVLDRLEGRLDASE